MQKLKLLNYLLFKVMFNLSAVDSNPGNRSFADIQDQK